MGHMLMLYHGLDEFGAHMVATLTNEAHASEIAHFSLVWNVVSLPWQPDPSDGLV